MIHVMLRNSSAVIKNYLTVPCSIILYFNLIIMSSKMVSNSDGSIILQTFSGEMMGMIL